MFTYRIGRAKDRMPEKDTEEEPCRSAGIVHGLILYENYPLTYSYKSYQPVAEMIGSHIGPTLLLMGVSLLVGLMIAVPAGIYSAVHRYQKRDFAVVTASFAGSSIPSFFLALILIYLFTVRLGWLPSSGMKTPGTGGSAADIALHMVMPVLVLAVSIAGSNLRCIRSAVLEILEMDYLRTAKAKGM